MYYVYVYYHPITNEAVYVGKGTKDRYKSHLYGDDNVHHHNKPFRDWILQLRSDGLTPIIEQKCFIEVEQDAYNEERRLIRLYGRRDNNTGTLFNKTNGGEGYSNSGTGWSPEQRAKHAQLINERPRGRAIDQYDLLGNFIRRFDHPAALRESDFTNVDIMAIRKCCSGTRFSANQYRWAYAGARLANVQKGERVYQLHPDTHELIQSYVSMGAAHEKTNISASDIGLCIKGKLLTAGGSVWCSPKYNPTNKSQKVRRIEQQTQSGELIATFRSASSAARSIGIDKTNILNCLKGKRRTAGGYIWRYVNR